MGAPPVETRPFIPAEDTARAAALWEHVPVLVLSLAVVLAAAALRINAEGRVAVPFIGYALPEVCYFHRLTGFPCPGCGMTRSFVAMAHGQAGAALAYHVVGPFLFAFIAAQVPVRLYALRRPRAAAPLMHHRLVGWYLWAMVAASLLFWALRVVGILTNTLPGR